MTREQLTKETIAVWEPRTRRRLSAEDAREITENLTGFFDLLAKWSNEAQQAATAQPETGGLDA